MATNKESDKNKDIKQERKEKKEQEKREKKEKKEIEKKEKEKRRKEKEKKDKKQKKDRKEKKEKKAVETPVYSEFELNGTIYKTTFPAHFKQAKKWKPTDIGEIESIITGTIKNIFVKKGDEVKKGDCLLFLEAMKMNNEILSPIDGVVQDVFIIENSKVTKGTLMIKIVPDAAPDPDVFY